MKGIKIHAYLARMGVASRRKCEEYVRKGYVYVNGVQAHVGQYVFPEKDVVDFHNENIVFEESWVYYKFHKPRGVVTTCASKWEKTIFDIVHIPERVFPVGRLDKDTTGLLLLTNDGRIAHILLHPKFEHEKEYIVETFWPISDAALQQLETWVYVLGKIAKPTKITRISSWKFSIVLKEGRNRQIRRMVRVVGYEVKKLKRIRIGNITLWNVKEGKVVPLTKEEKNYLFSLLRFHFPMA